MSKDYYAILGVPRTATSEEIRSAYRSRAKQFHPDHFGKNSAPFRSVQEAYEVLSDARARILYDRSLREQGEGSLMYARPEPEIIRSRRVAAEPLKRKVEPLDVGTISPLTSFFSSRPSFDEIFENAPGAFDLPSRHKAERFRTLTMEILLTREQARRGGKVRIMVPVHASCPRCGGLGDLGFLQCWRCSGTGVSLEEFPLQVEFPPGIQDFYEVAVPLARFGIHEVCPILLFRISRESDVEEL